MQDSIQSGDPVAPVITSNVVGIAEINGVIVRLDFVTHAEQTPKDATASPNFILTSAQARQLATNLVDAAALIEKAAIESAAAPKH